LEGFAAGRMWTGGTAAPCPTTKSRGTPAFRGTLAMPSRCAPRSPMGTQTFSVPIFVVRRGLSPGLECLIYVPPIRTFCSRGEILKAPRNIASPIR
jgi:hypothetical protein